jgi:hypothetical protein
MRICEFHFALPNSILSARCSLTSMQCRAALNITQVYRLCINVIFRRRVFIAYTCSFSLFMFLCKPPFRVRL